MIRCDLGPITLVETAYGAALLGQGGQTLADLDLLQTAALGAKAALIVSRGRAGDLPNGPLGPDERLSADGDRIKVGAPAPVEA